MSKKKKSRDEGRSEVVQEVRLLAKKMKACGWTVKEAADTVFMCAVALGWKNMFVDGGGSGRMRDEPYRDDGIRGPCCVCGGYCGGNEEDCEAIRRDLEIKARELSEEEEDE